MGIDIVGLSRAEHVAGRHSEEVCDAELHEPVGVYRKLLDGCKSGCYRCRGTNFTTCLSYAGFDTWLDSLAQIMFGVSADEIASHPRRYHGQPFDKLFQIPFGNDVGVGPVTSAKLHRDFVEQAAKVKRGLQRQTASAVAQRVAAAATRKPKSTKRMATQIAANIAKQTGGLLVGSDDDPESIAWQWKWEIYRELRRVFRLASDRGIAIFNV